MRRASLLAITAWAAMFLAVAPAQAQNPARPLDRVGDTNLGAQEPAEWKESEAPPPPAFDLRRLVPVAMPPYMSLKFGVDPQTIAITGDGVVRYVVVAHKETGNAVNAFYEAIRCSTEEYKSYARYGNHGWERIDQPEWKPINQRNSIYTSQLARQALCQGHAPRQSVSDMMRELRQPEILR